MLFYFYFRIRSQAILIDRSLGGFVSRASGYEHIERVNMTCYLL